MSDSITCRCSTSLLCSVRSSEYGVFHNQRNTRRTRGRKKNLTVLVEQQSVDNESETTGKCVHLVMQLAAGVWVLISWDNMTAREKSREVEIFI